MQRSFQGVQIAARVVGWAVLALFGLPGCGREAADWPFDATEARRRQEETARALGVKTEQEVDLGGGVKLALVLIPAGEFMMGSPTKGEQNWVNDESLHRVTISEPFWIGKYEVTEEQWETVMRENTGGCYRAKNPVSGVYWDDIQRFFQKLNGWHGGDRFELPTEAQWEYACRAGTSTRFSSGDDDGALGDYAWHRMNSLRTSHPVGQKRPNAWGLHDMHGNVWEWCSSPYSVEYDGSECSGAWSYDKVLRGGSYEDPSAGCRSAFRKRAGPGYPTYTSGFRVIRSAGTSE